MYTLQKKNANTDAKMFILLGAERILNVSRRGSAEDKADGYVNAYVRKVLFKT